jgi:hypothetical protein
MSQYLLTIIVDTAAVPNPEDVATHLEQRMQPYVGEGAKTDGWQVIAFRPVQHVLQKHSAIPDSLLTTTGEWLEYQEDTETAEHWFERVAAVLRGLEWTQHVLVYCSCHG